MSEKERNGIVPGMENVPRNQWYVAAGRDEIGRELLARRLLNIPVILYRTENGEPVALHDRCPHRFLPFSHGKLVGNEVQCGYHGLRFGADGICTRVPTQDSIPAQMCVHSYPLVEKGLWTWIWLGDPDRADPALIPDTGHVKPGYDSIFYFCQPLKGDYLRLHENLMDTSHPTFLHPNSFDGGELADAPFRFETEGRMVRLIRETPDYIPNTNTAIFFNLEPGTRVRRSLISETHAPCLNTIINRFVYSDDPTRAPCEMVSELPVVPSGPKGCYHYMSSNTSFKMTRVAEFGASLRSVVLQDVVALEAIEQQMEDDPGARETSVHADAPSLRLRRIIQKMAADERL